MLTVAGMDVNDTICPITFAEVTKENAKTWAEFMIKLNKVLMVDVGESLCIMIDSENKVVMRTFTRFIYKKMAIKYSEPRLGRLFCQACRSRSKKHFKQYFEIMLSEDKGCQSSELE